MPYSYEEISRRLPIAYILHIHGTYPSTGGRFSCPFPDHLDRNPSFSVWAGESDGKPRWKCLSCGHNGDVVDLIKKLSPTDMTSEEAIEEATDLIDKLEVSDWVPVPLSPKETLDPESLKATVDAARAEVDLDVLQRFVSYKQEQTKSWNFTPEWLVENFGVGTQAPGQMIIPIWEASGDILAYKFWTRPQDIRMAASGSFFGAGNWYRPLYNDNPELPAIICEGESDVWNACNVLRNKAYPFGLLSGAGTRPTGTDYFRNRVVYLGFDGDRAGRRATQAWVSALAGIAKQVLVIPISPGRDLSTTADIVHAFNTAKPPLTHPAGVMETEGGYARPSKTGISLMCNWLFEPRKQLSGENGTAYEGVLLPGEQEVVLSSEDLLSNARIKRWSQALGRAWYGSDHDASLLLGYLQAEASFLPSGERVTVAGLHRGQYVWPGDSIGNDYMRYVPPLVDAHIENDIDLGERDWTIQELFLLRRIQKNNLADPVLAWLAAAPLRSLFSAFPLLAITGVFGSGKSKTTEQLIRKMTGSQIQATFTATTPHALMGIVGSTNAFPVHLDEWRRGARMDTMEIGRQVFRDAYTAQKSHKGGMRDNLSELSIMCPSAPIVVSGEDTFIEGSHADRMVFIRMHKNKHNYEAYQELNRKKQTGMPRAYLDFLYGEIHKPGFTEWLNQERASFSELSDRQRWNYHVLLTGWELLQRFAKSKGAELSEPNFSEVRGEWQKANTNNPLDRLIRDAISVGSASGIRKMADDTLHINVTVFQSYARNHYVILPGGPDAVERDIIDRYDGRWVPGDKQTIEISAPKLSIQES